MNLLRIILKLKLESQKLFKKGSKLKKMDKCRKEKCTFYFCEESRYEWDFCIVGMVELYLTFRLTGLSKRLLPKRVSFTSSLINTLLFRVLIALPPCKAFKKLNVSPDNQMSTMANVIRCFVIVFEYFSGNRMYSSSLTAASTKFKTEQIFPKYSTNMDT